MPDPTASRVAGRRPAKGKDKRRSGPAARRNRPLRAQPAPKALRRRRSEGGVRPPTGVKVGGPDDRLGVPHHAVGAPRPTLGADPDPRVVRSLAARTSCPNQWGACGHVGRVTPPLCARRITCPSRSSSSGPVGPFIEDSTRPADQTPAEGQRFATSGSHNGQYRTGDASGGSNPCRRQVANCNERVTRNSFSLGKLKGLCDTSRASPRKEGSARE